VVALFVPPSFLLSAERGEQHRAARLKGIAEIKERVLSLIPYVLVGSVSN